jgi:trehalose 6-phosphate synthase
MHSFRLRLILALIAGVTLVSVASTYFEVLAHKHALRKELEQRSTWMGPSILMWSAFYRAGTPPICLHSLRERNLRLAPSE